MARNRILTRGRHTARGNVWLTISVNNQAIAANTIALLSQLNAVALALRPFTIVRTHLDLFVRSDQSAAVEDPFGAFGAIVVSDQASATGVNAVPSAIANGDAPFFVWQGFALQGGAAPATADGEHWTIDSKSMRKVGNNEDIVFVVTNANAADGLSIYFNGRILVKLL